jgi:hypothetical protein
MRGPQGQPGVSVTGAIVDFTNTAEPGNPASASAGFAGANVRFIFTIPRGADGANVTNGAERVGIEILIAQRQPANALREQFLHAVIDEFGIAAVHETTRQRAGHAQARINLPEQERAIAADLAAGKSPR